MMRADPDMASVLEVPEEIRNRVRQRLDDLLQEEQKRADYRPSLRRFLCFRIGFQQAPNHASHSEAARGLPFPALYERGRRFSWNAERNQCYDTEWLSEYASYLYYRLYERVSHFTRSLWLLVRHIITGVP